MPSPGHPRINRNLLLLVIRMIYVYRVLLLWLLLLLCVAIVLLLLLLLVIVHLPPERGVFAAARHRTPATRARLFFIQTAAILIVNLFLITNEKTLVHPLAVHSLLCGFGFCLYCTSHGHCGKSRKRQPAAAKTPL